MNSSSPSNILLEAKDLHLDYPIRLYAHTGLRDAFIEATKHPWEFFMRSPENLPILKGVDLTIYKGDRVGLIGVNGAGKSSLCRVLCGMIKPNLGSVISSSDVEAVFDVGTGILPELTGRENAYLLARLFFKTRDIPTEIVEEALAFSELGPFLDAPFKTYSKGMQARLILSLISSTPSEILILDEVFDGADVFFKDKIAARMMSKIERSDAVVFVSHGPDQILQLCNRVIILSQGTIIFDGPPEEGVKKYLAMPSQAFGQR
jgi:ABC-2 type transport system ATP-binding protein